MCSRVKITYKEFDGKVIKEVDAAIGENLLRVAHANEIDLEGYGEQEKSVMREECEGAKG